MKRTLCILAGLALPLLFTACSQDKIEEFRITQAQREQGFLPDPLAFDAVITFCRYQSAKTGDFVDAGEYFGVFDGSRVRAFVEIKNLEPEKVHSIHLVWLAPGDLKEMFRKYAEITVEQKEDGGWRNVIRWKDALDLVRYEEEVQEGPDPHVMLDATMTADPERGRELGMYTLRVYFNRELLTEKTFKLMDSETILAGPARGEREFVMGEDAKLSAEVRLVGLEPGGSYEAELAWVGPKGAGLFGKSFDFVADGQGGGTVASSMDIAKDRKRKAGEYELRIVLNGTQVGTITQTNATRQWQQEWTSLVYPSDTYTVEVKHISGKYLEIDAVEVFGGP